jgi:hypothetical protein
LRKGSDKGVDGIILSDYGKLSAMGKSIGGPGIGIDALWQAAVDGRSSVAAIQSFDPAGFGCRIAAEVRDFKISQIVPKSYRKATKVMARDIELAVVAADGDRHARSAGLVGRADGLFRPSYRPNGSRQGGSRVQQCVCPRRHRSHGLRRGHDTGWRHGWVHPRRSKTTAQIRRTNAR